ncbi:MAG: 1-(5-phosphoribosyl)-5-[(5-phosphoribosylamino)methylideneamino]imidazole-4-carboxamide isomerase [Bacillota bacterium]
MVIYPAIDIKDGKCVRLLQGKFEDVTVFSDNPADMALKFVQSGAEYLHVVDLDGAKTGGPKNIPVISAIADRAGIPLQAGGGIRTIETMELILGKGVKRVILGTSAVNDQALVREAVLRFGDNLVVAVDARDGMVAVEGWARTSRFTAVDFAKKMEEIGVKVIIYTDISRDGMLKGPNLKAIEEMVNAVGMEVIASGGVSSVRDVKNLKEAGAAGAIIGKALYTGDIVLEEAIAAAK